MAIFIDDTTRVVVQGLTGGQGRYHGLRNKAYGTKVVGGVNPKRAGEEIEGVPVFGSVKEAVEERSTESINVGSTNSGPPTNAQQDIVGRKPVGEGGI